MAIILGLTFVIPANAAIIQAQLVYSQSQSLPHIVAGTMDVQFLGNSPSGNLGSITLYGKKNSGTGEIGIQLLSCSIANSSATSTCISGATSHFVVSSATTFTSSAGAKTIDLLPQSYAFLTSRYYMLAVSTDNVANSITLYGNANVQYGLNFLTLNDGAAVPTYFNSPTVGTLFYIVDTNLVDITTINNYFPTFASTTVILPDVSLIPPCPILGIDICTGFGTVISWAFVPPPSSWDQFITLKDDIKTKAPFGYFTSAINSIGSISGTSTSAFIIATSSPIMTYIYTPLRTGLVWLLYFAAGLWIYKRLTNIQI